jgi:hypothetical protein
VFAQINADLTGKVRQRQGRAPEPSACVIDIQSAKTSTNVSIESQGVDASELNVGRKRAIATDTLGLCPFTGLWWVVV